MTDDYVAQALGLQERFKDKPVDMFEENAEETAELFKPAFMNEYGKELTNRVFDNNPDFLRFEIEADRVIISRNCIKSITQTNFTQALEMALEAHEDDIADSSITVLILKDPADKDLPFIEIIAE